MKKTMAVFLAALMLMLTVSCLSTNFAIGASNEIYSGNCGANGSNVRWRYDSDTGELTISGSGAMENYPLDDTPVYQQLWETIRYITIENGVTKIGTWAFRGLSKVTSVVLPPSVERIGENAFNSCWGLRNIFIPTSMREIGYHSFDMTSKLNVYYAGTEQQWKDIMVISGAFKETPNIYYNKVYVSPISLKGGSVSGAGGYSVGDTATVIATPAKGYMFEGWYKNGNKISSNANYTFTVNSAVVLKAIFVEGVSTDCSVTLIASPQQYGSVSGGFNYAKGTTITVKATPKSGYVFDGWYKDGIRISNNPSYSFTVNEDVVLTAKFKEPVPVLFQVYLESVPAEGGSVIGGGSYGLTATVYATAIPNSGYSFLGWYKDNNLVSNETVYQFTLIENTNLWAKFEKEPDHVHTPGTAVKENEVASTCTEKGSYDDVVYCTECKAEISRTTVIVDALGHIDEANDGLCDRCGEKMTGDGHCGYCGKIHGDDLKEKLTHAFHTILNFFKLNKPEEIIGSADEGVQDGAKLFQSIMNAGTNLAGEFAKAADSIQKTIVPVVQYLGKLSETLQGLMQPAA